MHSAANLFPSHLEDTLKKFCEKLISQLEQAGFIEDISQIDHACYRVSDLKSYESYKRIFSDCGQLLSEAYINGRPIATYKLNQAITLDARFKIDVIELPAGFVSQLSTISPMEDFAETFSLYVKIHVLGQQIHWRDSQGNIYDAKLVLNSTPLKQKITFLESHLKELK